MSNGPIERLLFQVTNFHLARQVRMNHQTGASPTYRLLGSARHASHFSAQHLSEEMHVQ